MQHCRSRRFHIRSIDYANTTLEMWSCGDRVNSILKSIHSGAWFQKRSFTDPENTGFVLKLHGCDKVLPKSFQIKSGNFD